MTRKNTILKDLLQRQGKVAVAFSGGLDSSVLLAFSVSVLGKDQCLALTASTPYMMRSEMSEGRAFAKRLGVEQILVELPVPEEIAGNPPERCYLCKRALFIRLKEEAESRGFSYLVDGTNVDDDSDYRPGMRALRELKIANPLREAGMGKDDIRELARELNLEDDLVSKPAYACLLTRWEQGRAFSDEDLRRVDSAEEYLRGRGFSGSRVRVHGNIARLELPEKDWCRMVDTSLRMEISEYLKGLGYDFVSLDMEGYSRGSMNITSAHENA